MAAPSPAHPSEPAGGPPLVSHEPPVAVVRRLMVVPLIVTGLVVLTMLAIGGAAQGRAGLALEQCAQLDAPCDAAHPDRWINGNLNPNAARYVEGDAVPYRALLSGLTAGETYALTIGWDTVEGGRHVFDQLAAHDLTEAAADPCAGQSCSGVNDELALPADPQVIAAGVTPVADRRIRIAGGAFVTPGAVVANTGNLCGSSTCVISANPGPYMPTGDFDGTAQNGLTVWFTATADDAVVTWGGHIATRADWGVGKSAAAVSGSPYHMRLLDLRCSDDATCSAGNIDRSIQSGAVLSPASLEIRKQVVDGGVGEFEFTGGPSPVSEVTLVVSGAEGAARTFDGLLDPGPYEVAEVVPDGWPAPTVRCDTLAANGGSIRIDGGVVAVSVGEGEAVTCTFTNTPPGSTSSTTSTTSSTSSTTSPSTTAPSSTTTESTVVAAGVTSTVYIDDVPSPIGSLAVVPQPVAPGDWIIGALEAGTGSTPSPTDGTVIASSVGTLPASGGTSMLTILAGLALCVAGALLTRRQHQEAE